MLETFYIFCILQLADIHSTLRFLKNKTGHEANPVMAYLFDKVGVVPSLLVSKAAISAIAYAIHKEPYVLPALCAFYAYIVINNYRIGTKKK